MQRGNSAKLRGFGELKSNVALAVASAKPEDKIPSNIYLLPKCILLSSQN